MSKKQFEALDLIILSLIGIVSECINIWAFKKLNSAYCASIAIVLGLIALVRWNAWGLIVPLAAGIGAMTVGYFSGSSESINWILANTIGYLPLALELLWFKYAGKAKINSRWVYMLLYVVSGFVLCEAGRSLCYLGSQASFPEVMKMFFLYDMINLALGLAVYFIACKQKKFVVDMNEYLVELHSGTPTSAVRDEKQDYMALEEMADKDEVSDIALLDGGMMTEEDMKAMNDAYKKAEGKSSKFDQENQALKEYRDAKSKKTGGK